MPFHASIKVPTATRLLGILVGLVLSTNAMSHGQATYLGNSALVIESASLKVMFDPFFDNDFGIYQRVPPTIKHNITKGEPPFDNIDAIFISHAHDDHFNAPEVVRYLTRFEDTHLFAPQQAINVITQVSGHATLLPRLHSVALDFGDPPATLQYKELIVDVVRIPHAGWPGRQEVQNLVFRVTLEKDIVVMHMGDADPDIDHYLPFRAHWQAKKSDINFPPYWFFMSAEGNDILTDVLNSRRHRGIHVPMKIPAYLQKSGKQYFHQPGTQIKID